MNHSEIFIAQRQLNKQTKFQLLFSSVLDPNHILTFLLAHEASLLYLLTPTKSRPKRQRVHVYVKTEHCNIQFFLQISWDPPGRVMIMCWGGKVRSNHLHFSNSIALCVFYLLLDIRHYLANRVKCFVSRYSAQSAQKWITCDVWIH